MNRFVPKKEGEKSEIGEGNSSAINIEAGEGMGLSFLGEKGAISRWTSQK